MQNDTWEDLGWIALYLAATAILSLALLAALEKWVN